MTNTQFTSSYHRKLTLEVIKLSEAQDWVDAVTEWYITDIEEDSTLSESCVCGKEDLRYLFTIRNRFNGNILFPIGRSCIEKFGRQDLNEEVAAKEKLFKLLHAVEQKEFLALSSALFSRKL